MEETLAGGNIHGKGCRASRSLSTPLSRHLQVFTSPGALQTLSFWLFMEASLHKHEWLNHRPLEIELNLQRPPPPAFCRSRGWGWKFQTYNHRVGSPSNLLPFLQDSYKSPHSHYKRHLYCSHHLGNSKCFRSSVPEMRMKTKYISYYESQNHNPVILNLKGHISMNSSQYILSLSLHLLTEKDRRQHPNP